MKNVIISTIAMAFVFTACSSNNTKTETTKDTTSNAAKATQTTPNVEQLYACSMHPEVIGKKADKWDIVNIRDKDGNSSWPQKNSEEAIKRIENTISYESFQKERMV